MHLATFQGALVHLVTPVEKCWTRYMYQLSAVMTQMSYFYILKKMYFYIFIFSSFMGRLYIKGTYKRKKDNRTNNLWKDNCIKLIVFFLCFFYLFSIEIFKHFFFLQIKFISILAGLVTLKLLIFQNSCLKLLTI